MPFVRLAAELNKRGYKTLFLGNEKFVNLCDSSGVEIGIVSSLQEYETTYNNPLTWSGNYAQNHYNEFHFPAIKPTFRTIEKIVNNGHQPFVVYQDVLSGARMAAEAFNLGSCQIALAPYAIHSSISPPYPARRQVEESLWSEILPKMKEKARDGTFKGLVQPLINPAREELGLPPWGLEHIPDMDDSRNLIGLFPEWLKPIPEDWPKNFLSTGFILGQQCEEVSDPALSKFLKSNPSPIVFTFGTGIPVTSFLIEKICDVCKKTGKPGVFIAHSRHQEIVENAPFPLLILKSTDFNSLFTHSSLIVHHGGIGTCAQAFANGVPQLLSPYTFDQPDNAYLIWSLGVGNAIDFLNDSVHQITSMIEDLHKSTTVRNKAMSLKSHTVDSTERTALHLINMKENMHNVV